MHAVLLWFCLFVYIISCRCIYGAYLLLSFWGWFAIQWAIALIPQYRWNNVGVYDKKRPYQTTAKKPEQVFTSVAHSTLHIIYMSLGLFLETMITIENIIDPYNWPLVRQRVGNAESVSIWWRRHVLMCWHYCPTSAQVHRSALIACFGGFQAWRRFVVAVVVLDLVWCPLYIESMIFHHMRFISYPEIVKAEVVEIILPTFYST